MKLGGAELRLTPGGLVPKPGVCTYHLPKAKPHFSYPCKKPMTLGQNMKWTH